MTDKCNDNSKSILNEIGVHDDEDDDVDDDEELLEVGEQYHGDEEDVEIFDLEKQHIIVKRK